MTEQLKEENLIVIAVDNGVNDFVYPQQADFTFYGGLYRGINIIAVPKTHFELEYYGTPGIKVTPRVEGGNALVETEVWLSGDWSGKTLEYILKEQDGTVVETKRTGAEQIAVRFEIRGAHKMDNTRLTTMTCLSMSNPEIEDYESADPMLSAYGLIEMGKCWAGDLELTDYRISPIYGDISVLQNVYLFVGTREIFYPDVTLFYSMLQEQGVSAELYIGEGMNHDYPLYPIPEADDAIEQICSIIQS